MTDAAREDRVRRGVDAMRIGAVLLTVGVTIVAVPATIVLVLENDRTPWWFSVPVTLLILAAVGLAGSAAASGRRTTRLAARLYVGTVLVGTLLLPVVADAPHDDLTTPWLHAYLPSGVAACVLLTRHWPANLAAATALVLADLRVHAEVWSLPLERIVTDAVFQTSVLTMGAAVLTSVTHAQRELERQATATAERFLVARATEQLGRRGTQWDALVHDEILAALETIALAPPGVDTQALARATIDGLSQGPPTGDVDHIAFRAAVLEAVLTEYPTASTRCTATTTARVLPPDVAEALLMALTEALRNVAAHAYPSARGDGPVAIRLEHDAEAVTLGVTDRGRGFDRARVGPTSFGLALSIEGRVGAVGGLATVTSEPGAGTSVQVRWPAGGRGEAP